MRVAVYRTLSPVTQTSWNISLPCGQRKKGTSQCTLTALWQYINAPDGLLNQHIFPLLLLLVFFSGYLNFVEKLLVNCKIYNGIIKKKEEELGWKIIDFVALTKKDNAIFLDSKS